LKEEICRAVTTAEDNVERFPNFKVYMLL